MTQVQTRPSSLVIDLRETPTRIHLDEATLRLDDSTPSLRSRIFVRAFDIATASLMLVLAAPLMLILWILTRSTSSGPGVYKSERVGQAEKPFYAYKFRSMYLGADIVLRNLLDGNASIRAEYAQSYKLKKDPRVTPLGRHLRRLNLDELPQLVNVLLGQMSLVGPRPLVQAELAEYRAVLPTILRVKPGLTGLWQVSGRNNLTLDERTMLEVEYATTRTLRGDIKICLKTAYQMLRPGSNGAY